MLEHKILKKDYYSFITDKLARGHLRLPDYMSSDSVMDLIQCSIDAAENFLRFALVKQTIAFECDFTGEVVLPVRYFSKLSKLTLLNDGGKELIAEDYKVTSNKLAIDLQLPLPTRLGVEYVAEYPGLLPADIKQGVLKHMSDIYDKGNLSLCESAISLYQPHRIILI